MGIKLPAPLAPFQELDIPPEGSVTLDVSANYLITPSGGFTLPLSNESLLDTNRDHTNFGSVKSQLVDYCPGTLYTNTPEIYFTDEDGNNYNQVLSSGVLKKNGSLSIDTDSHIIIQKFIIVNTSLVHDGYTIINDCASLTGWAISSGTLSLYENSILIATPQDWVYTELPVNINVSETQFLIITAKGQNGTNYGLKLVNASYSGYSDFIFTGSGKTERYIFAINTGTQTGEFDPHTITILRFDTNSQLNIYSVETDSGKPIYLELHVPDVIGDVTFQSYTGSSYETFAVASLNEEYNNISLDESKLKLLNGVGIIECYGTNNGYSIFPKGSPMETINGSTGSMTYSSNQGSESRIGLMITLPPADKRTGINKIRLCVIINYNSDSEGYYNTTYLYNNSYNSTYGLKNVNTPWIATLSPTRNTIDFFLAPNKYKKLKYKCDDHHNINSLTLHPYDRPIYHGSITHVNQLTDSNSNSIPNCLESSHVGSVTNFLRPYGSISESKVIPSSDYTFSRNSKAYFSDNSSAAVNMPRIDSTGILIENGTTNLLDLVSSESMTAETTITVTIGESYTISTHGAYGTISISSAGTGIVYPGSPITITASSGSLVLVPTATGGVYPSRNQVENKSYSTTWISGGSTRSQDIIYIPTQDILSENTGTIEFVADITPTFNTTGVYRYFFNIGTDSSKNRMIFYHNAVNQFSFRIYDGNGTVSEIVFNDTNYTGMHRFCIRWNITTMSVWVDGIKIEDKSPSLVSELSSIISIGESGEVDAIDTTISDLTISNIFRSDAECVARGILTPLPVDQYTTYLNTFKCINSQTSGSIHVSTNGQNIIAKDSDGIIIASGIVGYEDCRVVQLAIYSAYRNNISTVYIHNDVDIKSNILICDNVKLTCLQKSYIILHGTAAIYFNSNSGLNSVNIKLNPDHRGIIWSSSNTSNITFTNVELDGNDASIGLITDDEKSNGTFSNCTGVSITHSYFHHNNGTPFLISESTDVSFVGNRFEYLIGWTNFGGYTPHTDAGAFIRNSSNVSILYNTSNLVDDNVFGLAGDKNLRMANNHFVHTRHIVIITDDPETNATSENVIIENNTIIGPAIGIMIGYSETEANPPIEYPCYSAIIRNNTIIKKSDEMWPCTDGISIQGIPTSVSISNNYLYNCALVIYDYTVDVHDNSIITGDEYVETFPIF